MGQVTKTDIKSERKQYKEVIKKREIVNKEGRCSNCFNVRPAGVACLCNSDVSLVHVINVSATRLINVEAPDL